jgi:alpha-1,2-rhamnosyltransferase
VSDADINHAYKRAAALLFPSVSEGYGLPIAEAAMHGLGTIASDIPPSREIGGDGVIYVPVDDAPALADAILTVLGGEVPELSGVKVLSWQQSAQQMLEVLDNDRYEYMLRK